MKYEVVQGANLDVLESLVEERLKKGWKLQGGVYMGDMQCFQAMTKVEKKKKKRKGSAIVFRTKDEVIYGNKVRKTTVLSGDRP